jgi:hypothetical protein
MPVTGSLEVVAATVIVLILAALLFFSVVRALRQRR